MIPPRNSTRQFFVAGGTLRPTAPSYVEREADKELEALIEAGEFAYVLTARQLGKSSLINRTAHQLKEVGVRIANIDLTQIGTTTTSKWYFGLVYELSRQLRLSVDVRSWWQEHSELGRVQRFFRFLRDVVLTQIDRPVVIFLDEIDFTLRLDFSDEFFAVIRAVYNARAQDPAFNRLTFVLSGAASPPDLIKDPTRTPFNIGQGILLQDFSRTEAKKLQAGLEEEYPTQAEAIFTRIYYWTDGHPYLTQSLCAEVVKSKEQKWADEQIDQLVEKTFISDKTRLKEKNLQHAQSRILDHPQKRDLLGLYQSICQGQKVADNPQSLLQTQLKLSGLVKVNSERNLQVRNKIYAQAFDLRWVDNNMPFEFVVGGALPLDARSYVNRSADDELFDIIRSGELAYVLATRQTGKTSLIARTAIRLQEEEFYTAIIDLTHIGRGSKEEWFLALIDRLGSLFSLSVQPLGWWQEHAGLATEQPLIVSTARRFFRMTNKSGVRVFPFGDFLRDVVLTEIEGQVVIFVDEVDNALDLNFSDDFFAAIRATYDAQDPVFERLTFVLSGVASRSDLIKDRSQTPFNIGKSVLLQDFSKEEAVMLKKRLEEEYPNQGETIFKRIYHWTNGHPYLTQSLCVDVVQAEEEKSWNDKQIDELVRKLFLSEKARIQSSNIRFAQDRILNHSQSLRLLKLYKKIYEGEHIEYDPQSPRQNDLKLSGVVKVENGYLRLRNKIYQQAFDSDWVKAKLEVKRRDRIILWITLLISRISLSSFLFKRILYNIPSVLLIPLINKIIVVVIVIFVIFLLLILILNSQTIFEIILNFIN